MTGTDLRAIVTDLVLLILGAAPSPTAVTTVTTVGGGLTAATILWGLTKLLKKIAIPSVLDAYARVEHVRGRNRAQSKVADALAERGTPSDLIQGCRCSGGPRRWTPRWEPASTSGSRRPR